MRNVSHAFTAPMNRNRLALIASTFLLSAAMFIWADLFNFSKVVYLPAWTKVLPAPINVPAYLAFTCLVPAAFVADSLRSACLAVAQSVLLSPLAAIVAYALNPIHQDKYLLANSLFNYVFIVLFHCLIPALLLVGVRAAIHYTLGRRHG